jgi:hypothetical protein
VTDLTTLRALAERVIADRARVNDAEANGEKLWCDGALLSRWMAEAASPNTILALLDRVERAEAALRLIVAETHGSRISTVQRVEKHARAAPTPGAAAMSAADRQAARDG